jgi:aspartate aminotransferase
MSSPVLSSIARTLVGSQAVEARRRADAIAAAGRPVFDLGMGEPDGDSPAVIKAAACEAIDRGETHYVDPRGLAPLRERIARFELQRHGLAIDPSQVVVTVGSLGAISLALRALLDVGDEVLIPEPYWGPYAAMTEIAGGKPVAVPGVDNGDCMMPDFDGLKARLTPRSKLVVLNSPNNPSGKVWSRAELMQLGEICQQHNLWILSDEVYSEMVFDEQRHVSIASLAPELAERTVIATSLSKTFAMTGWRVGYCVAPAAVAAVLARLNHYSVRCATSVAQWAAVAAFDHADAIIGEMRARYAGRRALVGATFSKVPEFRYRKPDGTFYAFVRVPDRIADVRDFVSRLLDEEGVVVSAGQSYGQSAKRFVRLSFAASDTVIEEGIRRLGEFARAQR